MSSALAVRSSVPPVPAATVARPRLEAALDAGRAGALTLVGAPPGWGKTVLLSGWAADHDAAWLTLGARHADSRRLWADVCDALGQVITLDDDVPLRLADALAGATERPVLVLDDLDLLRGPALASLGELLVHGGDALHVVAATRVRSPAPARRACGCPAACASCAPPTSRSRSRRRPRCSEELGLSLRPDLVARLLERTEGWAAGLRLAGLSLRGEADPDAFVAEFAGDDRAIADYLTGEVLAGLPAATRELLLRTSIAGRICGDLADALTGGLRRRARARGARAQRRVRRRRSTATAPGSATTGCSPSCCARACGSSTPASSRSCTRAPPSGSPAPGSGARRSRTRSPPAACARRRRWSPTTGSTCCSTSSPPRRSPRSPRAPTTPGSRCPGRRRGSRSAIPPAPRRGSPRSARTTATPAGSRCCCGRAPAATSRSRGTQATALLRDAEPGRDGDALRALALFHHGATEFSHGRLEIAAEQLEGAAALAVDSERDALLLGCLGRGAALELAEGRLRRADHAARNALALAEPRGWHRTAAAAWAYATLAAVHWHRDELDDAERRADAAAAAAYAARQSDAVVATRALRAHIAAVRGDLERARGLLRAVHEALPDRRPAAGALARRARARAVGARRTRRPGRPRPPSGSRAATRSPRCAGSRGCRRPTRSCTRCCACTPG